MTEMSRLLLFTVITITAGMVAHSEKYSLARAEAADDASNVPIDTASELREVWLRFHEMELCQGLDATFVFHSRSMEVRCSVEEEKAYQKFREMLEPLRGSYDVAMEVTRPRIEKKSPEDSDPPPSLWNNAELRANLQESFERPRRRGSAPLPESMENLLFFFLKQRLALFAEQTLDWDKRMKRYAADLPALVQIGSEIGPPDVKSRATAVALAHAQGVDKYAERLTVNLSEALPRSEKRSSSSPEAPGMADSKRSWGEIAVELSNAAQIVAQGVERFIHPRTHTVGLVDLRAPDLLESLRRLRRMVLELQRMATS